MKLFDVYSRYAINLVKGNGVHVYDENGTEYLDLYGGHGVISIGHTHPHYVAVLSEQLQKIGFYSNSVDMPEQEKLAEKLGKLSGYTEHALFLCNSGAEANENALKIASFHTGKKKVIAFNGSFHGRTAAALNVTYHMKQTATINAENFPVVFVDLNNETQVSDALKAGDVCAVIVEGVQGVGGLDLPTDEFLQFLRKKCDESDALLILDEIQSGYGRSGNFFAHQSSGVLADVVTTAKGMGNGFPIAGVLIAPKVKAEKGMLGTTFGGSYLACAAGNAVLDVLEEEKIMQQVQKVHAAIVPQLEVVKGVKQVKGKGLMIGVEFDFPVKELRSKMLFEKHIFTGDSANPNLLRILPPLNITLEQLEALPKALNELVL